MFYTFVRELVYVIFDRNPQRQGIKRQSHAVFFHILTQFTTSVSVELTVSTLETRIYVAALPFLPDRRQFSYLFTDYFRGLLHKTLDLNDLFQRKLYSTSCTKENGLVTE